MDIRINKDNVLTTSFIFIVAREIRFRKRIITSIRSAYTQEIF